MRKVILDTNFILGCVKNKIDFFEEISLMGIKIIIPNEVISEMDRLRDKNIEARIALDLLVKNKSIFEKLELGKGHVDDKIINFVKTHGGNEHEIIIATLDKEMKLKLKNSKVMVIREKKRLEII